METTMNESLKETNVKETDVKGTDAVGNDTIETSTVKSDTPAFAQSNHIFYEDDSITIETASEDDAEELLDIYAPYILETAITFEYTIPSVDEFRERIRNTLTKYPYIKAVHDGKIVGYAYASAFHPRAAYAWAIETSIYVKKDARKMGLGKKLYAVLETILKKQRILNLNACISCPKVDDEYLTRNSINFHEHLGYRFVGEFEKCGYKFNRWYNMVWMEKHIGKHLTEQPPVIPFPELTDLPVLKELS